MKRKEIRATTRLIMQVGATLQLLNNEPDRRVFERFGLVELMENIVTSGFKNPEYYNGWPEYYAMGERTLFRYSGPCEAKFDASIFFVLTVAMTVRNGRLSLTGLWYDDVRRARAAVRNKMLGKRYNKRHYQNAVKCYDILTE